MLPKVLLFQLNHKVTQILDSKGVETRFCHVTVYYESDRKEEFSSFETFGKYDASRTSPVELVELSYFFPLTNPKTKVTSDYRFIVKLYSRVTLMQKIKEEASFATSILMLFTSRTADVSIEYEDYIVADYLVKAFDGWIKELPVTEHSWLISNCKKFSEEIPEVFKLFSVVGSCVSLYFLAPLFFLHYSQGVVSQSHFLIVALAVVYFFYKISTFIGVYVRNVVRVSFDLSFIKLNKGDEKLIDGIEKKKGISWIGVWAVINTLIEIAKPLAAYFFSRL